MSEKDDNNLDESADERDEQRPSDTEPGSQVESSDHLGDTEAKGVVESDEGELPESRAPIVAPEEPILTSEEPIFVTEWPDIDEEPGQGIVQRLKDRLERAASEAIHERTGTPLDEEGKVDFESLDPASLQEDAAEIATSVLSAMSEELSELGQMSEGGDLGKLFDLGPDAPSSGEVAAALFEKIEEWAQKLKQNIAERLHRNLGLPLDQKGDIDVDRLDTPEGREQAGQRVVSLMGALGEKLEAKRDEFEARLRAAADQFEKRQAASSDDSEPGDDEKKGAGDTDELGNLIDFDEWRERFEKREASGFKLGDSLSETINNFIEGHVIPRLEQGGNVNLNIDQNFLQEHGPGLMKQFVQSLTEQLKTPKIELTIPLTEEEKREREQRSALWEEQTAEPEPVADTGPAEEPEAGVSAAEPRGEADAEEAGELSEEATTETDEAAEDEAAEGEVKVSLNFDLRNLFRRLFKVPPSTDGGDSGPSQ